MRIADTDVGEVATISDEWATIDDAGSESGEVALAPPESAEWATLKDPVPESGEFTLPPPDRRTTIDGYGPETSEVAMASPDWHTTSRADDSEMGEVALAFPEWGRTISGGYRWIKPSLDFALALVILLISTPIILLALVMVRLTSRGHPIYVQNRLGLRGRIFTLYKIRTMYQDSERDSGPTWSLPGDSRVTTVGRFLRATHLDELPQLINVLLGDMSLIGPRPERPELVAKFEPDLPDYRLRLTVRPGLTGLAQVQQPPDTNVSSVRRKLNYDLCYLEQMSPWLDFRLLLGTVLKCVGIPYAWIGRILQLPDPNAGQGDESVAPGSGMKLKTLVPDSSFG